MATVKGTCDPKFDKLKTLLQGFLDSGAEVGASIAVNVNGEDVVDIYGGHVDAEKTQPWDQNTIVNVYSTTKVLASLAVLLLIEKGLVQINDKVCKHWPEFGVNGKEDIEVRHLMSHTSGLAGFDDPMQLEDLYDEQRCAERLAAQAPWWTPGSVSGYHSITFGYLLGELVRRVTGLTLRDFIDKEINGPLRAEFQLGVREADWDRVATLIPPPALDFSVFAAESIPAKAMLNPALNPKDSVTAGWRNAAIASANGHTNARNLTRIFSEISLAGKTTPGREKPLLSKETADMIFQEQSNGPDLVVMMHWRFGVGVAIRGEGTETVLDSWLPSGRVCIWGGWGGSVVVMDLDRGLTIGYAMNKMSMEGPSTPQNSKYIKAIYEALGVEI